MKKSSFNSKINLIVVAFLFLLLILGCQPSGGELLPLPKDDVTIASSRFENDTAIITLSNITVKFYGNWDGNNNYNLRFVVNNFSDEKIKIIFDKFIAESKMHKINRYS